MMSKSIGAAILSLRSIPPGPMPTLDPFLFCVYHKDQYPSGNAKMEAPRVGNGQDFNPTSPYRMYHGDRIPGFPQHPHRGFETVTATMEGIIDHADSVGNAGRYGHGDVQWMTAGKGCVHSEMFPLLEQRKENPLKLFQIWLNLPKRSKMVEPGFTMLWSEEIHKWKSDDSKVSVTVWAGLYFGTEKKEETTKRIPKDSWAADPSNDVAILHIILQPGGKLTLPKANGGSEINRSIFYVEGESMMKVDGKEIGEKMVLTLQADLDVEVSLDDSARRAGEFLLLQGKPISQPVAQYGPFVMNTEAEINQAFIDYRQTQFGGWPWPRDDMVFHPEKGRFAKLNGTEVTPNQCSKRKD